MNIPKGYRLVKNGEIINKNDRWFYPFDGSSKSVYNEFDGVVGQRLTGNLPLIRKIKS